MKVSFTLVYKTYPGQNVVIAGSVPQLGGWRERACLPMQYQGNGIWNVKIDLALNTPIEYKYAILNQKNLYYEPLVGNRSLGPVSEKVSELEVHDAWSLPPGIFEQLGKSAAMHDILFRPETEEQESVLTNIDSPKEGTWTVILRTKMTFVAPGCALFVGGSTPVLGCWNTRASIMMKRLQDNEYETIFTLPKIVKSFEYKFFIASVDGTEARWEQRDNREFVHFTDSSNVALINAAPFAIDGGMLRTAGVCVPVFALRSHKSIGVGDFADLLEFGTRMAKAGLGIIQLLPINDTMVNFYADLKLKEGEKSKCWIDSYPYSAVSVYALHPIYADMASIKNIPEDVTDALKEAHDRLNDAKFVDYEEALRVKLNALHEIYKAHVSSDFDGVRGKLVKFISSKEGGVDNSKWLPAYCVFKNFCFQYCDADFSHWNPEHRVCTNTLVKEVMGPFEEESVKEDSEAWFWAWIQMILQEQITFVASSLAKKHVCLKGDLPIGVNRVSADTYQNASPFMFSEHKPEHDCIFNMDTSTGAPPDAFAENGQNWGFPTYNWEATKTAEADPEFLCYSNIFDWWGDRLRAMGRYCSAFRIDHVLGWFRIWEIPASACLGSGLRGHFHPSKPIHKSWIEAESGVGPAGIGNLIERLTLPWMPDDCVRRLCPGSYGLLTANVLEKDERRPGHWTFKKECATEVDCEKYLHTLGLDDKTFADAMMEVTRLFNNVILLPDRHPGSDCYYPRFKCFTTLSWEQLTYSYKQVSKEGHEFVESRWIDWDRLRKAIYRWHMEYFYDESDGSGDSNNGVFAASARDKIPKLLNCTKMLPCGEDLGFIAPCVPGVLNEFCILGLRVERMPSDPKVMFGDPYHYEYLTVATTSTHDMPPLKAWWNLDADKGYAPDDVIHKVFWYDVLHRGGQLPVYFPDDCIAEEVQRHMRSPSILCILPLQDLVPLVPAELSGPYQGKTEYNYTNRDMIINDPAVPRFYWHYRIPYYIEDIDSSFTAPVLAAVLDSGRLQGYNTNRE